MKSHKFKHMIYMILSCILLLSNSATVFATTVNNSDETVSNTWPKGPSVTAESAIVMDASTGLILYEKNSKQKMYPASITKILTTLVAIENSSLSETVTFSRDAIFGVDLDSSRVGIDVGEQLTMEESLYAIMLASANEVSYGVAEHVGGTVENFVNMMNERAKELGCVNTNFQNPHGLQNENHYTCAYDMALISQTAIKNTTFEKITGTRTFTIPPTNIQSEARPLANHHKFMSRSIPFEGAIGGKTGYTSAAKYTLVTYAKRGDMELISVVMASDSVTSEYSDTAALLNFGFDNFTIYDVSSSKNEFLTEDNSLFTKYSTIFNADSSFLTTGDDGYVVLPNSVDFSEAKKEVIYNKISSLNDGDNVIGHVKYTYQNRIVGQTDIIYRNNITSSLPTIITSYIDSPSNYASALTKNHSPKTIIFIVFLLVILLCTAHFILVQRPRIRKRMAYKKRRQAYKKYRSNYDSLE